MRLEARPWTPQDLIDDLQGIIDEESDSYMNTRRTTLEMALAYLKEHFAEDNNVLTNADYIRSMTDEELARVLSPHIAVKGACNCYKDWEVEMLEWLKQPWKEKK